MSNPQHYHHVTVTTRTHDAGTEDERTEADSVVFACTAPEDADCRTYPRDCGCEYWVYNDAGTHDQAGHVRTTGNPCWLADWFDVGEGAVDYGGPDADPVREGMPTIANSGAIVTEWEMDYVTWYWLQEPWAVQWYAFTEQVRHLARVARNRLDNLAKRL